ncbi:MAG: DUF6152 family protein [Rhodospirillaceae bacterium]|nr:DUF6152 family protein [Rhodospirillaceae bacterium]
MNTARQNRVWPLLAAWITLPAAAHHSAKIVDPQTVLALPGTVTRFEWANPHTYIYLETTDEAGASVEWEIETDAVPILARSGWTPESVRPGDQILVRARPDRNPRRNHALLVSLERQDGSLLSARSYFLRRPDDAASLARAADFSGVWELRSEDYDRYYAGWGQVEITEQGAAAGAQYDVRLDSPAAQCVAAPLPSILVAPYLHEIELRDDAVVIRNERFNAERVIYTDGRGHPENGERTNQGHSIGRWEGDALVVDTVLFADHRAPISGQQGNEGVPSGAAKHVVERYRLSEDRTRLLIDFTVEDPEFLAEPFSGHVQWYYAPHFEMMGFDCDRENSSRYTLQ